MRNGDDAAKAVATVRRVTWAGMGINAALFAGKLLLGIVGHSQALIADAVHTISDLSTDIAVLVGLRYWAKPADQSHPYGHERIETLVAAVIGVALLAVGAGIGYNALATVRVAHTTPPGWPAFCGAVASILVKEFLYRWTVWHARRIKSAAMIANAWHHRSDAFSSIPVALAVAVAVFVPDWSIVDHVGALVVSVFIVRAAWTIVSPALHQLIDSGASEREIKEIERISMATEGVLSAHRLRTRRMGAGLYVDLHVMVDGDLTVRRGHDIAEQVQESLLAKGPDVVDAVVHIEPYEPASTAAAPRVSVSSPPTQSGRV